MPWLVGCADDAQPQVRVAKIEHQRREFDHLSQASELDVVRANLGALFRRLGKASNDAVRERILKQFDSRRAELHDAVIEILDTSDDDEILGHAVTMAGRAAYAMAAPRIQNLAFVGIPHVKANAIAAIDHLTGWDTSGLKRLLNDEDSPAVLAAPAVATKTKNPPVDVLCLGSVPGPRRCLRRVR